MADKLAGALNAFFSLPAKKRRKPSRYAIAIPGERPQIATREGGMWQWWDRNTKAESSHLDNLRYQVEQRGGTLTRITD